jgi:hypothetical protein
MTRVESAVTSVTWLPFAALDSLPDLPLGIAVAHYDEPPGDQLGDLAALREADAFREANELRAWIDVEGGRIVDYGVEGRSLAGRSAEPGIEQLRFPAVQLPVIRPEAEVRDGCIRFVQTAGGSIGLPAPRPIRGKPYVHIGAAVAWTTLELVLHADGRSQGRLVAASPFPRHSVYGADGGLVAEHGLDDFEGWYRDAFRDETPWGAIDELEEELTNVVFGTGARFTRRRLDAGETLVVQGEPGDEMFLLLDGSLDVEIDGRIVAQVGAGAVVGELALLGDGRRQATLRAARPSRVAVLGPEHVAGTRLAELALARRLAQR